MLFRFRNGQHDFIFGGFADDFRRNLRLGRDRLWRRRFHFCHSNGLRCSHFDRNRGNRRLRDWLDRGGSNRLRLLVPFANAELRQNGFDRWQRLARFSRNSRNERLRRHKRSIDAAAFPEGKVG